MTENFKFKTDELIINGQASIITVEELTLKVLDHRQYDSIIKWLKENNIGFQFYSEQEDKNRCYYLTIYDVSWASVLKKIAIILENSDYSM